METLPEILSELLQSKYQYSNIKRTNDCLKCMGLQWKVINSRNNYADCIWFHIKHQILNEISRYVIFIFDSYVKTICIYKAANNVL